MSTPLDKSGSPSSQPIMKFLEGQPDTRKTSSLRKSFSQHYLVGFTSVLYYIGLLPFRLTLKEQRSLQNPQRNEFVVERKNSSIQIGFCLLVHFILIVNFCAASYITLYRKPVLEGKSLSLLRGTEFVEGAMLTLYYLCMAWFTSTDLDWWLKECGSQVMSDSKPYSFPEKLQNGLSIFTPSFFILANIYFHHWIWSMGSGEVDNNATLITELGRTGWGIMTGMADFWEIANHLVFYWVTIVGHVDSILFLGAAVSYRDRVREFIQLTGVENKEDYDHLHQFDGKGHAKQPRPSQDPIITEQFLRLEHFVNGINERVGGFILIAVMFNVPFYAQAVANLLRGMDDFLVMIWSIMYIFSIFFWMLTIAMINSRISNGMRNWLMRSENYSRLPTNQLIVLMSKVNSDSLALRGGNFFAISYPLVGTLVSLIITYAFIDQRN